MLIFRDGAQNGVAFTGEARSASAAELRRVFFAVAISVSITATRTAAAALSGAWEE